LRRRESAMTAKKAPKKPAKKKAPKKAAPRVKKQADVCEIPAHDDTFVTIYVMGTAYKVPEDATIMGAIEYAGYQIKRGAGCREGYCGACATVYRMPGDYKIYTGLACTTMVADGMYLAQIPSHPAHKAIYDMDKITADVATIQKFYPEVFRCVACNTCSKACPQELEVMDYIQAAKRGDMEALTDISFDCLACGLCAIRCPAEIVQMNVALLGKRLYGKYLAPKSEHLEKRIKEVKRGKYDREYKKMMTAKQEALSKLYYERDMES
jgi:formate hydrogenlyase subunit 6/NADH:ubiquinone oxidoreductase subunit I